MIPPKKTTSTKKSSTSSSKPVRLDDISAAVSAYRDTLDMYSGEDYIPTSLRERNETLAHMLLDIALHVTKAEYMKILPPCKLPN